MKIGTPGKLRGKVLQEMIIGLFYTNKGSAETCRSRCQG